MFFKVTTVSQFSKIHVLQCSHQDWRSEGHILADQLHVRAARKNVYPIYPVNCYCCQHFYINLFSQTSQTVQVVLKHQK